MLCLMTVYVTFTDNIILSNIVIIIMFLISMQMQEYHPQLWALTRMLAICTYSRSHSVLFKEIDHLEVPHIAILCQLFHVQAFQPPVYQTWFWLYQPQGSVQLNNIVHIFGLDQRAVYSIVFPLVPITYVKSLGPGLNTT